MRWLTVAVAVLSFAVLPAMAQDPAKVDPDHYKVEFENEQVRVIRITYGPGEKSVMHDHPDGVAVFLTPHRVKFLLPDGTSQEVHGTAGQAGWTPAGPHLPENVGDQPLELILVELKAAKGSDSGDDKPAP